jgi:hypothetical protein
VARPWPEKFQVAFSFSGKERKLVEAIATAVENRLGSPNVFVDAWFEAYLPGPDADLKLQRIYRQQCELVVLCISETYGRKPWTLTEHEAIRARLMEAREASNECDKQRILPVRVGEGDIEGVPCTWIYSDARKKTVDAMAQLIVDRLGYVTGTARPPAPEPAVQEELIVEAIESFDANKDRINEAVDLYENRIPEAERYGHEEMIAIIDAHLSGAFAPRWKMHLLLAEYAGRVVGMLVCYEDIHSNFAFVSYLVAVTPRRCADVGTRLAKGLLESRRSMGLPPPRFLFEVDHPALTSDVREQHRRLGRIRMFSRLAPSEHLRFRALGVAYLQPDLNGLADGGEKRLLLCYATLGIHQQLSKSEVEAILTWVYTQLYEDSFEDPVKSAKFALHTRALLATVCRSLPEQIDLLRYEDILTGLTTAPKTGTPSPSETPAPS